MGKDPEVASTGRFSARKIKVLGVLFLATYSISALSGCSGVGEARIYNLDTGEVLKASFENNGTGHGKVFVHLPDGRVLEGEYSTISGTEIVTGTSTVSGTYGWAMAQGFSFKNPGRQYGAATAAGHGIVMDVVYELDPWTFHGFGVGRDNKGRRYRVQF